MTATPSPKKDVIYVDIEDDITSIIEKVKNASTQIVALVPPKRIGVLQSVVNLKLLQRSADTHDKRVVLITSDHALSSLAAGASIPVARNLQSKPEIPEITTSHEEEDDIIDGEDLSSNKPIDSSDEAPGIATAAAVSAASSNGRMSGRIPNFDSFRNRAALIGLGLVLLVGFGVWAIVFAPKATVVVTAKTTPYSVNKPLTATASGTLNAEEGVLGAIVKEIKKSNSVDFQATGKKEVGEKATGSVKFSQQALSSTTIPAGTELETSGGLIFVTNTAVTVPASTFGGAGCFPTACPGTASGSVTASQPGSNYNAANGNLSGAPSGVSTSFAGPTTGGTDKTITVVSESDAAAAREKLAVQNTDEVKAELKKQFANDSVVVEESFTTSPGAPGIAPAIGEEATTAKLTLETTYSLAGLKRTDLVAILEADLRAQLSGIPNQSIYDKGIDTVRFSNFRRENDRMLVVVQTTGYIGPKIDAQKLATQLVGKREGEIIAHIKTYDGVDEVSVRLSPFWVSKAPSENKIVIEFKVNNAAD